MKLILAFLVLGSITMTNKEVLGQDDTKWNHETGLNIFQLLATTLDLTYNVARNPRYSISINAGYTLNYANSYDFIGFILSPHYKCGNDGYSMKNQSGGFIKAGLKYNLRSTFEKKNYFFLSGFITNSWISERAEYQNMDFPNSQTEELSHHVFISGITGAAGYNFKIANKLNSDVGVHISIPSKKYTHLYGYSNYIPGMGYMETCGNEKIFPMLVLNLKYSF